MFSLRPNIEAASLLRRIGVVLGSTLCTAYYSSKVILNAALGRLSRAKVDQITRSWSRGLLRLVRMNLSVHGQVPDFNDGRRYILLSSHASHYDIPATFVSLPGSIRMLAKKELYKIPLLGRAMREAEFPSIDRRDRTQAVKDLAKAKAMMESGIVLWVAPEGTRSADGQLQRLKKGGFHLALDTDAVIVPMVFRGIHNVLPARTWRFNLGQPVELHIGQPLDASQYSYDNLDQLMAETHAQMKQLLAQA